MKRLQAAMRDRAAGAARANRHYYRVGSFMKGCANCGDTEWVETKSGGEVLRYLSGFQVFRSYDPKWVGWTWWCYECGAKDLQCWTPDEVGMVEAELGKPPVQGSREAKALAKYRLRKELVAIAKIDAPVVPTCAEEIAALEKKIDDLVMQIKGGK
jgi:hypothetical protein